MNDKVFSLEKKLEEEQQTLKAGQAPAPITWACRVGRAGRFRGGARAVKSGLLDSGSRVHTQGTVPNAPLCVSQIMLKYAS